MKKWTTLGAVFLAIVFNYILIDDLESIDTPELNYQFTENFFNQDFSFDIKKYKKQVLYLLKSNYSFNNQYNDLVTENDKKYFSDLLLYLQPIVYTEGVYIGIFDEETDTIKSYFRSSKTIDVTLLEKNLKTILDTFKLNTSNFQTDLIRKLFELRFKTLQGKYLAK